MSKNLSNNQILLNEILRQEHLESGKEITEDLFFEFFSCEQILKKYDLSYDDIEKGIKGGGLDGGCDGIYLFINGVLVNEDTIETLKHQKEIKLELFIIQSKNTTSFKEDAIMKWKTVTSNLLQLANNSSNFIGRYNADILEAFDLFKQAYIKLIRSKVKLTINYIYITKAAELHPNVKLQANELEKLVKELYPNPNVSTSVEFIGADKLMTYILYTLATTDFSLKLIEPPISIGTQKDYIALVSLSDYFKFITDEDGELINHIFESNVRDYQGSTSVNLEIYSTLQEYGSEDFWWLNNGITILASEAIQVTGKELLITEPEIVNGLQTSTEIYNYFSKNLDKIEHEKRCLLIRLIVPIGDESRDRIILATNSQTNIPKSSLRTTDAIHRQIELYFKTKGLYYDRRKNYYKNQGKKSTDIVSVSFLSQCLMSILLQKPDSARARPSTLLADDDAYNTLYLENQELDSYYNAAAIGKKVDEFLKKYRTYPSSEKGDILFYLVYALCVDQVGKIQIRSKELSTINLSNITDDLLNKYTDLIYNLYISLGGSSKVAKGTELIKLVKNTFCN